MPYEIIRGNSFHYKDVDAVVAPSQPFTLIDYEIDTKIKEIKQYHSNTRYNNTRREPLVKSYNLQSQRMIYITQGNKVDTHESLESILYQSYIKALELAKEHHVQSIAFSVESFVEQNVPAGLSLQIALKAVTAFLMQNDMMIYLVSYEDGLRHLPVKQYQEILEFIKMSSKEEDTNLFYSKEIFKNGDSLHVNNASISNRQLADALEDIEDTFSESLLKIINRKGLNDPYVYKKANIDRKLFSKLKNKDYHPSKNTVISLALALELNLDETQDLLGKAGYKLSKSVRFDCIIIYHIQRKEYDVNIVNISLFELTKSMLEN